MIVMLKTGRFDNIDSAVIINSVSKAVLFLLSFAYSADDDSWIYIVETYSLKIYCGFIFLVRIRASC